jgi:phytoene synthase
LDWFDEFDVDPEAFLANPQPTPEIKRMTKRLVMEANRLYFRSEPGIAALPRACRPGIFAARLIYAGIGREVRSAGYDSISGRAHTSKRQKLAWVAEAGVRSVTSMITPGSAVLYAKPLEEVGFLVDAAAQGKDDWSRADALVRALAQLRATDNRRRSLLSGGSARPT